MRINVVLIRDFLSIERAAFSLDEKGLILVQGSNEDNPSADSNGSGKSSLMDAVCWALYGETARGVATDAVIRSGAKAAEVLVSLCDDNGDIYQVVRSRAKGKVNLHLNVWKEGAWVGLTAGTTAETQAKIERILGCSLDVFRTAVYVGQEGMPDLPAMTDKRLKELVEEAAGVGVIEAAYEKARSRLRDAENDLARLEARRGSALDRVKRAETVLESVQEQRDAWEGEHAERMRRATDRVGDLIRRLAKADEAAEKALAAKGPIVAERERIVGRLVGFEALRREERHLEHALRNAEMSAASVASHVKTLTAQVEEATKAHTALLSGSKEVCDACGQPLEGEALEHRKNELRDRLGHLETLLSAARSGEERTRAKAAEFRKALEEHRARMPDVSAAQERLNTLDKALREIEAAVAARDVAKADLERARDERVAMGLETNPYLSLVQNASEELQEARGCLSDAERLVKAAEELVERRRAAAEVFSPAGVRARILDQVTPYLNTRTAEYLDALSDATLRATWSTLVPDGKGGFRERFSIKDEHPAGEGFQALSGGEKRKVRIACALALQDLVASRAAKPFRLFIADEIDDALDRAGLERLMGILQAKAKERGTTVVISHNDLRDWIDDVWTVTRSGGVSRLETT